MTDFDQTLTKLFYLDNKTADSSFRAILDSSFMPEEVKTLTRDLFAKYHPMEMDLNMSLDEKERHMLDWWHGNMKLI
jgi:Pyrimidine 5'-nucleotidase (UMPH-1)